MNDKIFLKYYYLVFIVLVIQRSLQYIDPNMGLTFKLIKRSNNMVFK